MKDVILENVSKRFGEDVIAVHELNLEIEKGEFLVLLGPSGCGKTTVLRLIAGLETVTRGKISIAGSDVTDTPPRERNIAMVFQNYALYPHMTAFENIAFGLRLQKVGAEEIESRVRWAAGILGIGDLLNRRPKALSGGERQRIALGRALVRKPSVFLFDEPLSNLDAKLRVQMRHEILNLHRQIGATAVYVTHDQFEAMTMGDRIAVLEKGELRQVATPGDLYHKPKNRFVAEFIGTPAINIIRGSFDRQKGKFVSGDLEIPWPEDVPKPTDSSETQIDLGIRPESLLTEPSDSAVEINCIIERIENLGGEHHVYSSRGDQQLVSRISGNLPERIVESKEIKFYFNFREGKLFDSESGLSLRDC